MRILVSSHPDFKQARRRSPDVLMIIKGGAWVRRETSIAFQMVAL